jgi:hypothetical protein
MGQAGPQGPKGDKGDSARTLWAVVNQNGTISRSSGTTSSGRIGPGLYRVTFNQRVNGCAFGAVLGAAVGYAFVAPTVAEFRAVTVRTLNDAGGIQDRPFHLVVLC